MPAKKFSKTTHKKPVKKAAGKTVQKKPVKKKTAAKKTPVKKPVSRVSAVKVKKATPKKAAVPGQKQQSNALKKISAEERFKLIELEAFLLAERNHFAGDPLQYWVSAEADVLQRYPL